VRPPPNTVLGVVGSGHRPCLNRGVSHGFAYVAAALVFAWGTAHLVPTKRVVAGFGDIGADNRRVLTMEWVAEGLAMLFVAVLVALTAASSTEAAQLVYPTAAGFLVVLGVWTAFTGARTPVVWFKACPVVMAIAAGLLMTARLTL
jgi:hypothetical protein